MPARYGIDRLKEIVPVWKDSCPGGAEWVEGEYIPSLVSRMYIQTERLLRNFMNSDLEIFLAYRNDPVVAKFQGWGLPYPREKAEAFVASMMDRVALKQDGWI